MISFAYDEGSLRGIRMARGCPQFSHCFFTDDTLIFLRAADGDCRKLKEILDIYCFAFGQEANLEKSSLFLSAILLRM